MTRSLRTQMASRLALALVGVTAGLVGASAWFSASFTEHAGARIEAVAERGLDRTASLGARLVETHAAAVEAQLDQALRVAEHMASEAGGFAFTDRPILWHATDQSTGALRSLELPAMRLGERWLGQEADFAHRVPFIDQVSRLADATVTVFQRMNPTGDMLRVATSVPGPDGRRAIGTFIPAASPDGPSPVVASVLKGHSYLGLARVVDRTYMTAYRPIRLAGEIVGMLYVGVELGSLAGLQRAARATQIGTRGHLLVLKAAGPDRGTYVVGPTVADDGRPMASELVDPAALDALLAQSLAAPEGRIVGTRLWVQPAGGVAPYEAVVRATALPKLGWVVLATASRADQLGPIAALSRAQRRQAALYGLFAVLLVALVYLYLFWKAGAVIDRINRLRAAAQAMAHGGLDVELPPAGRSELGRLAGALRALRDHLVALSDASVRIAHGDLSVAVPAQSEDDQLAAAYSEMVSALRDNLLGLRANDAERAFVQRLESALAMAQTESEALDAVRRGLVSELPDRRVQLLLADSSHAHLAVALKTDPGWAGCGVKQPSDCPAVRSGAMEVFPDSTAYTACRALWDREAPCAAVCTPVRVAGRPVGVLHATGPTDDPQLDHAKHRLHELARRAGDRVGVLRAFARSESQAATDPLTGLLNRRRIENLGAAVVRAGQPFAALFGDLDHFKALNDTHGHETGDRALRLFSRVLSNVAGPEAHVARWGGEEFVVLVPGANSAQAARLGDAVRAGLVRAQRDASTPAVTVSFGVASSADADGFHEVVQVADAALYRAKQAGRDRVAVHGQTAPPELAPLGPRTPTGTSGRRAS